MKRNAPADLVIHYLDMSLSSGGKLSLSFTGNPLTLTTAERTFMYELVDALNGYVDRENAIKDEAENEGREEPQRHEAKP